jgi:hypothetical protein
MIPGRIEGGPSLDGALGPTGPTDSATISQDQNDNEDGVNQFVGGVLNVGQPCRMEMEHVRQRVQEVVRGAVQRDQNIINMPPADAQNPVNENTLRYMSMAFPTLFPDGRADFNQPRLHSVTLGDYFKHLHLYKDGRFA